MRRIIFLLIGTLFLQGTYAKEKRPSWTDGYFKETQNSYIEQVLGCDYQIDNARLKAVQQIIERRSIATGTGAKVSIDGNNVQVKSEHDLIAKARIIDEYIERKDGRCSVYLLVQTAKNPTLSFDPVNLTTKYPFSARVFVPGMAQIHKGSIGKGSAMIAGEILFVGGVIATECLSQYYMQKIGETHINASKQHYAQNANICKISRNISIAGIAAVYVWSVIDGIVAKGDPYITIGDAAQLHLSPYADYECGGISATIKF